MVNGKIKYVYSKQNDSNNQTCPNLSFLFDHNIGLETHPADWFEPWLPFQRKRSTDKKVVTIEDLTTWTNTKALLANAGSGGGQYANFKPFDMKEV